MLASRSRQRRKGANSTPTKPIAVARLLDRRPPVARSSLECSGRCWVDGVLLVAVRLPQLRAALQATLTVRVADFTEVKSRSLSLCLDG